MSDDKDESQKTEDPTDKKLKDAHKKGEVAKSQEVNTWFVLAATAALVTFMSSGLARDLSVLLLDFIERPHAMPMDGSSLMTIVRTLVTGVVIAMALPLGLLFLSAVTGNMIQHKPVFTAERMKPKLDKLSPLKGFKRIFGMSALVNFFKGLGKMALVGLVAFAVTWPNRDQLANIISWNIASLLPFIQGLAIEMLGGVLAILAVIAIFDFMYQKHQFTKKQRMTKQNVKDEHKQSDGDPTVKAKLRQLRMERGRKRMMAAVPDASVVIVNPTHFAVALKYDSASMAAPVCVAKGVDQVAARIRAVAEDNEIPIVENPPLARALYASIDIDDDVPTEHYEAVAKVIGYVMRLGRKTAPSRVS